MSTIANDAKCYKQATVVDLLLTTLDDCGRGQVLSTVYRQQGTLKSQEWKTREWKSRHHNAVVEIAGEGKVWQAKVLKCISDYID